MTEQMNVPKLRFSEFEGEYIDTALEDLTKKKISYGIVQAGPHIPDGMPYIKSTNLNKELCLDELERTSDAIAKSYQRSEVAPEDIVFSLRGNIGATRIVPETIPVANLTQGTARLSIRENFSNVYVNYCLSTRKAYKRVNSVSKGSTFQEISLADLRKVKVTHSVDIKEQQKIASFLSKVDQKITLLSEKKDKLTEYKKGVMQQLFNGQWEEQDGLLTFIPPTLRFKADDGSDFPDWEERKLADLGSFIGGGTPDTKNADYWAGETPWISSSDVIEGNIFQIERSRFITDEAIATSATKIVPANSILIVSRVGVGKFVVSKHEICTSQDFSNFTPEQTDVTYMAYNLYVNKHKLEGLAQGTSIKGFTTGDLKSLKLGIPCIEEQTKIANFLSAIDQKIDLANSELEKAKEWKKGLLQQMFV
tara:strand:+ start:740 stop:2005 length:1266 start_codon:yes stop_codon:yes gene_type:complete